MTRKATTKPQPKPLALAALKRASQQARELARQTKTPAWIMEGDKLVDVTKSARKPGRKNGHA